MMNRDAYHAGRTATPSSTAEEERSTSAEMTVNPRKAPAPAPSICICARPPLPSAGGRGRRGGGKARMSPAVNSLGLADIALSATPAKRCPKSVRERIPAARRLHFALGCQRWATTRLRAEEEEEEEEEEEGRGLWPVHAISTSGKSRDLTSALHRTHCASSARKATREPKAKKADRLRLRLRL